MLPPYWSTTGHDAIDESPGTMTVWFGHSNLPHIHGVTVSVVFVRVTGIVSGTTVGNSSLACAASVSSAVSHGTPSVTTTFFVWKNRAAVASATSSPVSSPVRGRSFGTVLSLDGICITSSMASTLRGVVASPFAIFEVLEIVGIEEA